MTTTPQSFTLPTSVLRAAMKCSAVKDIRYYMNGVCIRLHPDNVGVVASTNGHMGFLAQAQAIDVFISAPIEIIVPLDDLKKLNAKLPRTTFEKTADGRWLMQGGIVFAPHDGKFPDMARVMAPQTAAQGTPDADLRVNAVLPEYFTATVEALRLYHGTKKDAMPRMLPTGQGMVLQFDESAAAIIMAYRQAEKGEPVPEYDASRLVADFATAVR
jgi:hypothetical protein